LRHLTSQLFSVLELRHPRLYLFIYVLNSWCFKLIVDFLVLIGYFAKEGIKVAILEPNDPSDVTELIGSGKADLGCKG
jgi:hypothetical protein